MLVQSVILLFELKHFGRVPLFKRFCHLLFAALLYDSTEPSYFGMAARRRPFLCLLSYVTALKILAPCGIGVILYLFLWKKRITVVIKLLFVVTSE